MRYEGMGVLSLDDGEFACPICKTVSEFVVPIVALSGVARSGPGSKLGPISDSDIPEDPNQWITGIELESQYDETRPSIISTVSFFLFLSLFSSIV